MAFTLSDLIAVNKGNQETGEGLELFSGEIGSAIETWDEARVDQFFPNAKLNAESGSVIYLPVNLCHTLPTVNARRRAFAPQVLANSFATARHGLVNMDHILLANGIRGVKDDAICGHNVDTVFDPMKIMAKGVKEIGSGKHKINIPVTPAPIMALVALFTRSKHATSIVGEQAAKAGKWSTSMECGHQWGDAFFLYRDELIPFRDAPAGMLECVKPHTILPYKGYEVAALLGGLDGKIDFWGMAMTQSPADKGATTLAMLAPKRKEMASAPIYLQNFQSAEAASEGVDKLFDEIASATVIGTTGPAIGASTDHVHEVLSDGTVLPHSDGHSHSIYSFRLATGKPARFEAKTSEHTVHSGSYEAGNRQSFSHLHLVDLNLTKPDVAERANHELELSTEDEMTATELLKKMETLLSSGKPADTAELAALRSEVASLATDEKIEAAVKAKLESGDFVPKTKYDTDVASASVKGKEEAKTEFDAAIALAAKKAERNGLLKDAGIELASKIDGLDVTYESYVGDLANDGAGDKQFATMLALAKRAKAASPSGGAGGGGGRAVPTVGSGGSGGSGGSETASKDPPPAGEGQKKGKHAFTGGK